MKDHRSPQDRKELAENIRDIRAELWKEPRYARAFCFAVIANFRTGLAVIPTRKRGA